MMLPVRTSLSKTTRALCHWLAASHEDDEQEIPRSFGGVSEGVLNSAWCNGNLSS